MHDIVIAGSSKYRGK